MDYICTRCGKNDAEARVEGCSSGPCPMIPVVGPLIDLDGTDQAARHLRDEIDNELVATLAAERPGCMRVTLPAGTIVFVNAAPLRVYSACEVEAPIENLEMAGLI